MYHGQAVRRSPEQNPASPTQYSPPNAYNRQDISSPSGYHHQRDHRGQPPSPTAGSLPALNGYPPQQRDPPASTFYNPTSENGEWRQSWNRGPYPPRSPSLNQNRREYFHNDSRHEYEASNRQHPSPVQPYKPHPSPGYTQSSYSSYPPRQDQPPHSPTSARSYNNQTIAGSPSGRAAQEPPPPQSTPSRAADPMSFSNILSRSDSDLERTSRNTQAASHEKPNPSMTPRGDVQSHSRVDSSESLPSLQNRISNGVPRHHVHADPATPLATSPPVFQSHHAKSNSPRRSSSLDKARVNGDLDSARVVPVLPSKPKRLVPERDVEAALVKIDAKEHSDVENVGFEDQLAEYILRRKKRRREFDGNEAIKCKRRRIACLSKLSERFFRQAEYSKVRFRDRYEQVMFQEVQHQEIADEKERKKDMQRKRRREKTLQTETQKRNEALQKANQATDEAERNRFMKEVYQADRKVIATDRLLRGETTTKELREISPQGPNMEGGVMTSFPAVDDLPAEPMKKRPRTGGRLKKSREQKQAEKDAAASAHAAMERDELRVIAPSRRGEKRESGTIKESAHEDHASPYSSKAYNQLYDSIWRDIARKDVPKLYRIKDNSTSTKQSNLRKTAILASKEARKWQAKTNKSTKDSQARAKRVMREMLSFWKRNEREERDQRKMAEKQELENAKKAEADREANRQKRKLNFLISQTELYSHFIGKKVKTDEVERSTDDVSVSDTKVQAKPVATQAVSLPDSVTNLGMKVTNFEDLDFDADDETALHEAAMANAQNAVQEAQDRARAFNKDGELQSQFDEGEMNFQNPTSLQSMDVAQPKMLTCQLKEYQLKGLNWLVNLYEQGINGILADEMGLGKTVQSISVMAYLAEVHNIWGPFLVIAPASTLHNWQQEVVRFVPNIKVLPYWGNGKDRKVLRKFWDRKHITYTKNSPFHVLVTSYQLVVQDTQYFQKVRWQYMILDEAQAIKSSQSSRWKSLLGFHCRNRLLLTGTPIQNNMQELWALLHFIMPSLFDSHDEFSDWFSKDIESHAQSNTKLNEDQLKRLHMILKPFMLRRIKRHVQKELGDKIEQDVFCDLTYRQRAYYSNLRNKISIMDLIEKAAVGDDQDTATLMNLVMQFRKVCNHPDLFERADTMSPVSFSYFAETASFMREGYFIDLAYSVRNLIEYKVPRLVGRNSGRLDIAGPDNDKAGWRNRWLYNMLNIWSPDNLRKSTAHSGAFSWLPFCNVSPSEASSIAHKDVYQRALGHLAGRHEQSNSLHGVSNDSTRLHTLFKIVGEDAHQPPSTSPSVGRMSELLNVSRNVFYGTSLNAIEPCNRPAASAPPIELYCASQGSIVERQRTFFNVPMRAGLNGITEKTEKGILDSKLDPTSHPICSLLPPPISEKARFTSIQVPSMRRFVTDSGKLAKLDHLLGQLKEGGHRVLLYFQMTRMIDLMEEYLTYRNYKYCRLDGSTKLEDRRDTVADFQNRSDIFIFLLSTRAGGLGINLTAADTVIFYDSDWNPTIDSQAMDRAHRLGQTKQVTVYRLITRGTIEERIRKRALQKEEVQRVVISGGAGAHVDFNTRSRENRTKDIAMWLADDDQAEMIEKKEAEIAEKEAKEPQVTRPKKKGYVKKRPDVTLDDMYHEGEGHFDDASAKASGAATPVEAPAGKGKRRGISKKAKSVREKLAIIDGGA